MIHHIDEDTDNNRLENLAMMTREAHLSLHHKGKEVSDETRRHMSESAQGRSQEFRDKVSKRHKGMKHTDAAKQKMSLSQRGKKRSPETRERIRQANLGKTMSEEAIRKRTESRKRNKEARNSL